MISSTSVHACVCVCMISSTSVQSMLCCSGSGFPGRSRMNSRCARTKTRPRRTRMAFTTRRCANVIGPVAVVAVVAAVAAVGCCCCCWVQWLFYACAVGSASNRTFHDLHDPAMPGPTWLLRVGSTGDRRHSVRWVQTNKNMVSYAATNRIKKLKRPRETLSSHKENSTSYLVHMKFRKNGTPTHAVLR